MPKESDIITLTVSIASIQNLNDLNSILPAIAEATQSEAALLYIYDNLSGNSFFMQKGLPAAAADTARKECTDSFAQLAMATTWTPLAEHTGRILTHPLKLSERCVGLIGLQTQQDAAALESDTMNSFCTILASIIHRNNELYKAQHQLKQQNVYLTVSTMLAQSLDLDQILETALFCCMDAVSAEAASILLLDDAKKNFYFYEVEGPAKVALAEFMFPADKGIAASILASGQAEIINNVQNDARLFRGVDKATNIKTNTMIAVPLIADKEKVGVLEIINKTDNADFIEEDRMLLLMVAEEIAFAIRNAKIFEYVANIYCKQRQGQNSCKGCVRPLGSWTPCIKYRDISVSPKHKKSSSTL